MQRSSREEVGVEYWVKWQVPVCGIIMIIPAAVALRQLNKSKKDQGPIMEADMWLPAWKKLHPKWLLIYRAMAFLTMAYLLYEMIVYAGFFAFFFYTQWTFTLVMLYFAVGTLISAKGCWMYKDKVNTQSSVKKSVSRNGVEAANWNQNKEHEAGFLGSLLLIIYQISAGASLLTDLVFWLILMPILSKTQFQLTLVIACIHSVNAIFLIIDSLLNTLPFQWIGFNYFIIWTVTYAAFQWVSHACCTTWWAYPFLELSNPWAPMWYIGIALIHVPCYALYVLLVNAKNSIFSKLFPKAFQRSHGGLPHHDKTG